MPKSGDWKFLEEVGEIKKDCRIVDKKIEYRQAALVYLAGINYLALTYNSSSQLECLWSLVCLRKDLH